MVACCFCVVISTPCLIPCSKKIGELEPICTCTQMCMKVCGKTDPGINDKPKTRFGTIENWKKFISHFVSSESKWNVIAQTDNPTQSKKISALVKSVNKRKIQGNGVHSKKSRTFTKDEFREILKFVPPAALEGR